MLEFANKNFSKSTPPNVEPWFLTINAYWRWLTNSDYVTRASLNNAYYLQYHMVHPVNFSTIVCRSKSVTGILCSDPQGLLPPLPSGAGGSNPQVFKAGGDSASTTEFYFGVLEPQVVPVDPASEAYFSKLGR
jgi:hypothetical protein